MKIKTAEEKTGGGILLPTTAQTKPNGGEVVAVGEGKEVGKKKLDLSVKVINASYPCLAGVIYFVFLGPSSIGVLSTKYFSLCRLVLKSFTPSMLEQRWSSMVQSILY